MATSVFEDQSNFWMNAQTPANLLAAATIIRTPAKRSDHELIIRQKPQTAKVFVGKEKDRKPIDPPPIIQLRIDESADPNQNYLQSPYFFVSCSLLDDEDNHTDAEKEEVKSALAGTLVSSLHRLKDTDNADGGFFVFGDLSVKMEGSFRLKFTLYEVHDKEVEHIRSIETDSFQVYPAKNWPGMAESTFLTRSFSDQGVRLRLRKEPRFRLGNRGPASDDYQPRHYNRGSNQGQTQGQDRRQSQAEYSLSSPNTIQPQANYQSAPRTVQDEYPMSRSNHQIHPQMDFVHSNSRKRNHDYAQSQSSHSGSQYSVMDEPALKRTRSDASDHSLRGQPYQLQSSLQYGGGPHSEAPSMGSYTSFSPQLQPPQQIFNPFSSITQAGVPQAQQAFDFGQGSQHPHTQISGGFPSRRIDTSFPSPAVTSGFESPTALRSALSVTPLTQHFQNSPSSATQQNPTFGFLPPIQQAYVPQLQQMTHGHPSPQQFTTQLQQPIPQSRAAANSLPTMDIYQNDPSHARTGISNMNEMPPPMIGNRTSSSGSLIGLSAFQSQGVTSSSGNMGLPFLGTTSAASQLPSPLGNVALGGWSQNIDQYGRPRDDHGQ